MSDPVVKYQEASRQLREAAAKVESAVRVISDGASKLANWKTVHAAKQAAQDAWRAIPPERQESLVPPA